MHLYCKNQICASNNAAHTWLRKVAICVTISIDRIYLFLFFILFMLESASNCCTHSFLFSPLLWNVWIKSRIRIVFLVNLCNCRLKWHLFQKEACPPHPRGAQSPIGEASKLLSIQIPHKKSGFFRTSLIGLACSLFFHSFSASFFDVSKVGRGCGWPQVPAGVWGRWAASGSGSSPL